MRESRKVLGASLLIFLAWASGGWAHEGETAKENPKLVYVQASASRSVPVDAARLTFSFPVERGSFGEADQTGRQILEGIRQRLQQIQGPKISLVIGWDLLKQAKLSWGEKGKKIEHTFAVEAEDITAGKLHEVSARVIDECLKANTQLELERVEVYLTPAHQEKVLSELYKEAAGKTLTSAKEIAEASGTQLVGARFLLGGSGASSLVRAERPYSMEFVGEYLSKGVEIRQSFKVRADVPDHLELSTTVSGAFEIS